MEAIQHEGQQLLRVLLLEPVEARGVPPNSELGGCQGKREREAKIRNKISATATEYMTLENAHFGWRTAIIRQRCLHQAEIAATSVH